MLSDESKLIYDILRAITCDDDIYKIIEADEVLSKLPENIQLTKVQLSAIIKDLKERDYINVKYFTPDEYCLLTLKRIEEVKPSENVQSENNDDEDVPKKERISYDRGDRKVKTVKSGMVFLMAFLGALLGSTIVAVIVAVMMKTVL